MPAKGLERGERHAPGAADRLLPKPRQANRLLLRHLEDVEDHRLRGATPHSRQAGLVAGTATLGALFFGEVMQVPTCVLCWYQRIFMFPLALILPVGMFPFDRKVIRYALPLASIGWLFAAFHVLLVAGVVPETVRPCSQGVPCSEVQIQWLGFVNIPLLSFIAFSVMNALLIVARKRSLT